LVFSDEIWTVGQQLVSCTARCVCWCAVMLEDESGGSRRLFEKNDNLVIIYKQSKLLFVKASL